MTILLYDLVGADQGRPFSPHCWKVAFALLHKQLPFRSVPTCFTGISKIEGGAARALPLLRDGERLIADSFAIALYLEETYPDRPSLFAGEGGKAAARFIEQWTIAHMHAYIGGALLVDIHDVLDTADQAYFRQTREARFGRRLEAVSREREAKLEAFRAGLKPLRTTLANQSFLGGAGPLFSDYIVAGALQWARVISPFRLLDDDDPVHIWFERCLDLHDGFARRVAAAA